MAHRMYETTSKPDQWAAVFVSHPTRGDYIRNSTRFTGKQRAFAVETYGERPDGEPWSFATLFRSEDHARRWFNLLTAS
jgi:hypothetical protein